MRKVLLAALLSAVLGLSLVSCADKNTDIAHNASSPVGPGSGPNSNAAPPQVISPLCAPPFPNASAGSQGKSNVFMIDPIVSSGNQNLMPNSSGLDQYVTPVALTNLNGLGVLDGSLVSIRNRVNCADGFGAYDEKNQFLYSHSDFRFQEAMSYYYSNIYQGRINQNGFLISTDPVVILAHCESVDNSYFTKDQDQSKKIARGREFNEVCLGDSNWTSGAYYADDAQVVLHELQHAATVDNYSPVINLNQFSYDEAGDLNEGISDASSLAFTDVLLPPGSSFDTKLFSRWALGTFNSNPNHNSVRGAHRCPMYDSSFPNCTAYPAFTLPSDANGNKTSISYVYPDGLGWPFPNNYKSQNMVAVSTIYQSFASDEEIHNDDVIIVGALWEIYSSLKQNRQGDAGKAFNLFQKLVLESVRHLPLPTSANRSPVTFIRFSNQLVSTANLLTELTVNDRSAIVQVLKDRGLYNMPTLQTASWVGVGPGTFKQKPYSPTPGVFIQDNPQVLAKWLRQLGIDSIAVPQGLETGLNSTLDPGELAVIWFDLQNNDDLTVGGALLTVTSTDPDIQILDARFNVSYRGDVHKNQTQIMYGKINGKTMGTLLNPVENSTQTGFTFTTSGNTYFTTDPLFGIYSRTGVWIKANANVPHGKVINFEIQAIPANGSAEVQANPTTVVFPVTIN